MQFVVSDMNLKESKEFILKLLETEKRFRCNFNLSEWEVFVKQDIANVSETFNIDKKYFFRHQRTSKESFMLQGINNNCTLCFTRKKTENFKHIIFEKEVKNDNNKQKKQRKRYTFRTDRKSSENEEQS